jgi:hypothetical protein
LLQRSSGVLDFSGSHTGIQDFVGQPVATAMDCWISHGAPRNFLGGADRCARQQAARYITQDRGYMKGHQLEIEVADQQHNGVFSSLSTHPHTHTHIRVNQWIERYSVIAEQMWDIATAVVAEVRTYPLRSLGAELLWSLVNGASAYVKVISNLCRPRV